MSESYVHLFRWDLHILSLQLVVPSFCCAFGPPARTCDVSRFLTPNGHVCSSLLRGCPFFWKKWEKSKVTATFIKTRYISNVMTAFTSTSMLSCCKLVIDNFRPRKLFLRPEILERYVARFLLFVHIRTQKCHSLPVDVMHSSASRPLYEVIGNCKWNIHLF